MTRKEAIVWLQKANIQSKLVLKELMQIKDEAERMERVGEYYMHFENCLKEIESCEVAISGLKRLEKIDKKEKRRSFLAGVFNFANRKNSPTIPRDVIRHIYSKGENEMNVEKKYLTVSKYNRPGSVRPRTAAVACHYIGNPGTSAQANHDYFESLSKIGPKNEKEGKKVTKASCHYIIGLNGEILQLIPEEEVSWCTNQANSYTISIEACHPDKTGKFTRDTYEAYVALCADICRRWGLDPLNGGLIRHYDVTKKPCPKWFVDHPDAWEKFKKDVATTMCPKKSGWYEEDGGWRYYLGNTGEPIRNDWHEDDDGNWYWHDGAGIMVCDTWKKAADGKWYYLGADGKMKRDSWVLWKEELYRLNEDGSVFLGKLDIETDEEGGFHICKPFR